MMSQSDEVLAFQMAQQLEQENRRRRIFDEKTFEEAIIQAAGNMITDWAENYIGYFNRQEETLLTELTQFLEEEEEL
jgi:hypothetical protein